MSSSRSKRDMPTSDDNGAIQVLSTHSRQVEGREPVRMPLIQAGLPRPSGNGRRRFAGGAPMYRY